MKKTEQLLESIGRITRETGIPRTIFAVCPNSVAVTKAAFRAARRNNAPIYFAATLNQIDVDGGYTGCKNIRTTNYHTLPSFQNISVLARLLIT